MPCKFLAFHSTETLIPIDFVFSASHLFSFLQGGPNQFRFTHELKVSQFFSFKCICSYFPHGNWTYDLNFDCLSYRDFSYRMNITLVWTTRFTSISKGKLGNLALDKCLVLFSTWVLGESWLFHTTNCLYAQRRCSCQCSTCFRDVLHPRPGSTKALHRCCAIRIRWRRYSVMSWIQIAGRGHNGIQIPLRGYGCKGRRKKN